MNVPDQQNVNDVPDCLRTLADAVEADPLVSQISVVVLVRVPNDDELIVLGYGIGEETTYAAFTDCHIAAAQLLDMMRAKR
jgi:hypothetical protein